MQKKKILQGKETALTVVTSCNCNLTVISRKASYPTVRTGSLPRKPCTPCFVEQQGVGINSLLPWG